MFQLLYRSRFERVFKKLDHTLQTQILRSLEELAKDPFSHPQAKKLQGSPTNAYRVRIDRWRVIYLIVHQDKTIEVIDLFMKKSPADYQKRFR